MSVYNITVIANHTKHSRITSILSLLQGWKAIRLARSLVQQSWQPRNDAGDFVGFALSGICLDKGLRFCHENSLSRKWVDRYLWETIIQRLHACVPNYHQQIFVIVSVQIISHAQQRTLYLTVCHPYLPGNLLWQLNYNTIKLYSVWYHIYM